MARTANTAERTKKKQRQEQPFEFFYTTKCYISIDTSISNIRLKIITCNFAFECMAKEHATQCDPNSNALSIFLGSVRRLGIVDCVLFCDI